MASSSDGRLCTSCAAPTGLTTLAKPHNLCARLTQHQAGVGADFTAARRPVEMVYAEEHSTVRGAKNREVQLKRWSRAKKEALVAQDLKRLKQI